MAENPNDQSRDNLNEVQPETTEMGPGTVSAEDLPTDPPQPKPDTVPEDEVAVKGSRKSQIRAKRSLKQSVIRRICKLPSQDSEMTAGGDAEVVYTNSQFGQKPNPCSRSACNSCTLARPRRVFKPKSKPKLKATSNAKRSSMANKRNGERGFVAKSLLNIDQATNIPTSNGCISKMRQCLCTEVNGQIYKLMDLPTSYSLVNAMRRRPQQSKPRWGTKRPTAGKGPNKIRKLN